jgi:prolyl 4-hydroxylase
MKHCYTGTTIMNETPMVATIDDIITPTECGQFIDLAKDSMKPAKVSLENKAAISAGRSGSNTWLGYDRFDLAASFGKRISQLVGIELENAEAIQVIHYEPGQRYGAHYDAYNLATPKGQRCCRRGGQRLVTCLVYLNDVPEGGGTSFPKLSLTVGAKAGRMLIFHNVDHDDYSKPHVASLHSGDPVVKGEKWAMNIWFRQASVRQIFEFSDEATASIAS